MRSPEASTRAVELLRGEIQQAQDPGDEAALRCALGVQLGRLRQWDDALGALQKALGPAMQADDRATMMQICKELGKVYSRKGDRKRGIKELREGLDMFTLGEGPRTKADLDLWATCCGCARCIEPTTTSRSRATGASTPCSRPSARPTTWG